MEELCPLTEIDAGKIIPLEQILFSDPWGESALLSCLKPPYLGLVLRVEDQVAGYVLGTVLPPEGELLRIGVDPAFQRKGLGRTLAQGFFKALRKKGVTTVFLEVREGNLPARTLYDALGFTATGKRASYYRDPTEDAVLYQIQLKNEETV